MRNFNTIKLAVSVLLISVIMPACRMESGSGHIVSQTRQTGPFNALSVAGDFEVEIRNGDKEVVMIEADDNLIEYIQTKVNDGKLRISLENKNINDAHFKVFITTTGLIDVNASAGASIKAMDVLYSNGQIALQASSAGNIEAELNAPSISAKSSSGGELELDGKTRSFSGNASSGASIKASGLLSETSTANASSGATIKVHSSISLDAEASSGARVVYHGAGSVKKSVSSGAEIEEGN